MPNQMHSKALTKNSSRTQLPAVSTQNIFSNHFLIFQRHYELSPPRGLAGTLPRGHPARNLSLANPFEPTSNSQSQYAVDGLGFSQSPAGGQIKPLLYTASSLRGVAGAHEPHTTRHSTLGSRRGLWGVAGPVKARALQDSLAQKNRRAHNRSAKPATVAEAGGVLYSSHQDHVQNLLGKNIVEESMRKGSADLGPGLPERGQK